EYTPEIPSLAISHLSEYYYFYCNKLLHKINDRNDVIKPNPKKRKKDHSKLKEASQNRGKEFENKVLKQLGKQLGNVENCKDKSVSETLEILKTAQIGKFLYQPRFKIREELYDELGIKDFRLKDFVPDFIEVIKEDGKKCLMILDAKATKETCVSHQVQVTTYAYLLKYIVKNIENVEISISHTGGIFLPSAEGFTRQTFSMDLFLPKIERFLYRELPQIITTSKVSWHYNSRCKDCKFVDECRMEAEGTMAMIPYSSMEDASYLKQVLNKNMPYKNEPDIEDLYIYIRNGSDNCRVKQIIRYNTKSKKSPYLEHLESKKSPNFESKTSAQFIHTPTATFPQQTDHNLVIIMSWDNFVSRPFSWSICLYDKDGNIEKNFKYAKSNSKSENETLISFISLMKEFVTCLENIFEYLSQNNSRTCIFVYSQKEKISIQDSLLNLIALDSNLITKNDQFKAMRCLFNIFQDCSLLLAARNNDDESSKLPDEWREFPRLIVLENSLKENIAINVPGFYRITDVWEQMVMPTLENSQVLNNLESYIDKIDLENIYAKWVEDEAVNTLLLMRSEFINYVIKSYYALLKSSTNDIASILIFSPQKFGFSDVRDFNHHYLGKLYFFKQFEAFTSSNQKKRDRLKDLAQGEATCKIRFDKIIDELDIYESIAQFIVCDKESFTFEATGFKKFILVEDNSE
ncbi:23120_t:CDS:2, partial [Gigaspora margarita]